MAKLKTLNQIIDDECCTVCGVMLKKNLQEEAGRWVKTMKNKEFQELFKMFFNLDEKGYGIAKETKHG